MERAVRFGAFLILVLLLSASCSRAEAYYRVLRGNYSFHQGAYQEANVQYLALQKKDIYPEIIRYNLGNVYYVLGETMSAEEEWLLASGTEHPGLLFRLNFNRGVLYYERSEYEIAFHLFRKALELQPDDIYAKRNLELCLSRMQSGEVQQKASHVTEAHLPDDMERAMQYIRRRGEGAWISKPEESGEFLQDW